MLVYLSWFSIKKYQKVVLFIKKWLRETSVFYSDGYMDFLLDFSGSGLWISRFVYMLGLFLSIVGMYYSI
jgi:hypothetical protein